MSAWQGHAIKYADRNARTRADSFLFDDNQDAPHAMDYFIWLLQPCMCDDTLRAPYTSGHVCDAFRRLYSGKVRFYQGDAQVADGVTVHCIGGHSRGLEAVRVRTQSGWMVLASDAAHYYENVFLNKPFPIVVDLKDMYDGVETLKRLASDPGLIIPGHEPLGRQFFPQTLASNIRRLDVGPTGFTLP